MATVVSTLVARDTTSFAAAATFPREFETYYRSAIYSFALSGNYCGVFKTSKEC